jgi:ABC-type lipoprotein release transport system permease subunit
MTSLLFEVSPYDAISYVTVASGLMAAAGFAAWVPTRRALRVDPAVTLRIET